MDEDEENIPPTPGHVEYPDGLTEEEIEEDKQARLNMDLATRLKKM